MTDVPLNYVRFVKLHLKNYGIFLGSNELNFDRHRTLIVGGGGSGKTLIANALAKLGPVKGIKAHFNADHPEMSVEVVTKGNRNLVNKYGSVIFLSCEFTELPTFNLETPFAGIFSHKNGEVVMTEARTIFHALLSRKPMKNEIYKNLNPVTMAAGERVCLGYAYSFAIRKVMNLDLPVVLDSPYSRLDPELRHGVRAFLKEQPCQQILLGGDYEFKEEDKPHYILDYDYMEGCSRVRKATCDDR